MPKGKPFPNMMDNEIVEVLFTCLTHTDNMNINYSAVARDLKLNDATTAKSRLARAMKAQQEVAAAAPAASSAPSKVTKAKDVSGGARGKDGRKQKGAANGQGNENLSDKEEVKVEDGGAEDAYDAKIKEESDSAHKYGDYANVTSSED